MFFILCFVYLLYYFFCLKFLFHALLFGEANNIQIYTANKKNKYCLTKCYLILDRTTKKERQQNDREKKGHFSLSNGYIFRWRSIVSVEFVEWSWRSKTTTSTTRTEIIRLKVRWNGLRCCGTEMLRGWWWRWAVMLRIVTNRMICPRRRRIGSSQSVNIYESTYIMNE